MKSEKNKSKTEDKKSSSPNFSSASTKKDSPRSEGVESRTANGKKNNSENHSGKFEESEQTGHSKQSRYSEQGLYRQMNLSVTRITNGIQTDIRVHHETGKPTDIYVSQGSEAWTLSPEELDQLPEHLEKEVKMLLNTGSHGSGESWAIFGSEDKNEKKRLRS
ncbi:MAG: hypothetical protein IJF17_08015 [Thermoguttaceae bacterium]|nr:hypothetical protein [Thermoguttaceae bacterium]